MVFVFLEKEKKKEQVEQEEREREKGDREKGGGKEGAEPGAGTWASTICRRWIFEICMVEERGLQPYAWPEDWRVLPFEARAFLRLAEVLSRFAWLRSVGLRHLCGHPSYHPLLAFVSIHCLRSRRRSLAKPTGHIMAAYIYTYFIHYIAMYRALWSRFFYNLFIWHV